MSWTEYELCTYTTPKRGRDVPDVRMVAFRRFGHVEVWILLSRIFCERAELAANTRVRLFRGDSGLHQGQLQVRADEAGPLRVCRSSGRKGSVSCLGGVVRVRGEWLGVEVPIEKQSAKAVIEGRGVVSIVLPKQFQKRAASGVAA